jgi:hypothetical protein
MARPTDWNPLASSDPIPGDPGVVRQAAQNYADVAEAINTARDRLNAITFKGKSHHIDELRGKCEDLVVQIKQASSRCSGAAGALKTYAGALEGAQAKSLPILKEAKEAQGDQRRWKQEEWEQYYRHQRTTNPVERSRAESDYRAAQSKRAAAEGRIAQARERLKAVIKERDEAGNRAADALRETSRNSPLKDTFWEKVQNVISDVITWLEKTALPALDKISVALAIVTIAVTVLTGGAPAWLLLIGAGVAAATTAANLAVNAGKVADGKMSWGEFLLRTSVDVVTTAAAFAGVGKAASAAKGAVESAGAAAKGATSASKGTLSTIVSRVKGGAGKANDFLGYPGKLVGDAFKASAAWNATRTVTRATIREVAKKSANDALRHDINVLVDRVTRGKTDRNLLDSLTVVKFYHLITTGDTKPQTASAPSSGAGSAGGGGGGGGW